MLDSIPDNDVEALIAELEHVLSFVAADVTLITAPTEQVRIRPIPFIVGGDEHIRELAEYLRMSGKSIGELRDIENQIREIGLRYTIPVVGLSEIKSYINGLAGEMALQEAFPKRGPFWQEYYLNSDPRSYE